MKKSKKITTVISLIALLLLPCIVFGMFPSYEHTGHGPKITNAVLVNGTVKLSCPKDIYPTAKSRENVSKWIECFNSVYPDVVVKVEFSDRAEWDARRTAKNIGDVFWLDDSQVYALGKMTKYLMPLDSYAEYFEHSAEHADFGLDLDAVYPVLKQIGTADDTLYMAGEYADMQTFTYNKNKLKDAGLEKPVDNWSLSEFKKYIKTLTVVDDNGKVLQVGAAMDVASPETYIPFFMNECSKHYELVDYKYKKINFTDSDVVRGAESLADALMNKYIYPLNDVNFEYEFASAFSEINNENIITKAVFITLDSYSELSERAEQYKKNGIDWDIVSYPLFGDGKSLAFSSGYGVYGYTSNPAAAAALCLTLWTPDYQRAVMKSDDRLASVLKSVNDTTEFLGIEEYPDKNYGAFYTNLEKAVPGEINGAVPEKIGIIIFAKVIGLLL